MKKLILLFIVTLFAFNSFGAKITDDALKIGEPGSVSDKVLKLGDTRLIRSNETSGQLEFTNDGLLYKKIGSGSGSGGDGGVNILANSSFEDGLGDWVTSGGTLTQETYVNALEGNTKYARFVSTTPGEYVESACTTKPDAISGGGMADIRYLGGSGNFDLKVIDCTSGDVEISTGVLADITEWLKAPTQTFDQTAQYKIRVISTAAASIDIDLGYAGSNKGFIAGTYSNSCQLDGGDGRSITSGTESIFWSGSCTGWISGPDGTTHANGNHYVIQKNNSVVEFIGVMRDGGPASTDILLYKNGVYYKRVHAHRSTYLTTGKPIRFISSKGEFSAGDKISFALTSGTSVGTLTEEHYLNINEQSGDTSEAFTPEQAGFDIAVEIGGASFATIGNSPPQEISNGSLDMVLKRGSAKIPCSGTNPSTGLTCSAGSESWGIVFNAPRDGQYEVCTTFSTYDSGDKNLRHVVTENSSQTVLDTGLKDVRSRPSSASNSNSHYLCNTFSFGSTGEKTIRMFSEGPSNVFVAADRNASQYERATYWTVRMVSHNVSRPIIQNMVSTSLGAGMKIERCDIAHSGVPSMIDTAGACSSWLTSLTDVGTGLIGYNVKAGVFSSISGCFANTYNNNNIITNFHLIGTSTLESNTRFTNTGGVADYPINIYCVGER